MCLHSNRQIAKTGGEKLVWLASLILDSWYRWSWVQTQITVNSQDSVVSWLFHRCVMWRLEDNSQEPNLCFRLVGPRVWNQPWQQGPWLTKSSCWSFSLIFFKKWILRVDSYSNNLWKGPFCTSAALYYVLIWISVLSTDYCKMGISSTLKKKQKQIRDALCPVVSNIHPRFNSLQKTNEYIYFVKNYKTCRNYL